MSDTRQEKQTTDPKKPAPRGAMVLVDDQGVPHMRYLVHQVRDASGRNKVIRSMVTQRELTVAKKEIACWGNVWTKRGGEEVDGRSAMITAEGYRTLQQLAQITVVSPPYVSLPAQVGGQRAGETVPNPFIITNPTTNAFEGCAIRKVGMAYGPTGNLTFVDRTLYFTLFEYFRAEVVNTAEKHPTAAIYGGSETDVEQLVRDLADDRNLQTQAEMKEGSAWKKKFLIPESEIAIAVAHAKRRAWRFLEIDRITGMGIWYDCQHEAIRKSIRTYTQSGQFGIRKAEAIVERNVLRSHPLMPNMSIDPNDLYADSRGKLCTRAKVWTYEVVDDATKMQELLDAFQRGLDVARLTAGPVSVDRGDAERVQALELDEDRQPEEVEQAGRDVEDADETPEDSGERAPADERGDILNDLHFYEETLGDARVTALREQHDCMNKPLVAKLDELRAYRQALSSAIDQEATPK